MVRTSSNERVWLLRGSFVFFFAILCLASFAKPIRAWQYCVDPTAEDIEKQEILDVYERLTHTQNGEPVVDLWVRAHFKRPVESGRYQIELWHQETGSRIKYKGPYDICCGLKANSSCGHGIFLKDSTDKKVNEKEEQETPSASAGETTQNTGETAPTDCPIEGEFIAHVAKSLHQEEGKYEITFQLFGGEGANEEELLCAVVPFEIEREKEPKPPRRPVRQEAQPETVDPENEEVLLLSG
eukprot:TRINITY_DN16449_c0_g1_i1.p1 TRINITY_DN16449_c0_g1~~TRINITY_DN16449_c0_g1_i1.p1  ORF type:complete len:241 (-),score=63.18 TRINITY_DN16449_c0_g1_i1:80-802(-)